MLKTIVTALTLISLPAFAQTLSFTGQDLSGRYQCKGQDSHIGDFKSFIDLKINPAQSTGIHGAYDFIMTLPDNSTYDGFAAASTDSMALYFAHRDPAFKDYGVGISEIARDTEGKVSFTKYYYGPQYEGGGHGFEQCSRL